MVTYVRNHGLAIYSHSAHQGGGPMIFDTVDKALMVLVALVGVYLNLEARRKRNFDSKIVAERELQAKEDRFGGPIPLVRRIETIEQGIKRSSEAANLVILKIQDLRERDTLMDTRLVKLEAEMRFRVESSNAEHARLAADIKELQRS